ncbi:MAG TPA: hypothetical protein VKV95_19300 [Terriglobia bacterium]|nr:hypothetical protein [Terriglobia bacterium]
MADPNIHLLRHSVAILAYRGGKALRNAPAEFAQFKASPTSRTPVEILAHLGDLLDWACRHAQGKSEWHTSKPLPWDQEVVRFFAALDKFDKHLASTTELGCPPEKLFQGPIADALTHVGQIAMLRRMSGSPIKGENYYGADIAEGRVGPEQSPPGFEFD